MNKLTQKEVHRLRLMFLSVQGRPSVDPGALSLVGHSEVSGRHEGSDRRRPHDLRLRAEGGAVR